jgi:hypothetical protein
VTYAPAANYSGSDSFTYTLNGGSTATVSITVTNVNDAPDAVNDAKTVLEDSTPSNVDVLANDTDTDNASGPANAGLTVIDVSNGSHGTVAIAADDLSVTYLPEPNFYGTDTFTYTISDNGATGGTGHIDTATVTITVTNVNDAPDAVNDAKTVVEDSGANSVNVLANDTDGDNLSGPANAGLTVLSTTNGAHGTVAIAADGLSVSYTPDADYSGGDSFTYTISDNGTTGGVGHVDTATVTITVTNLNGRSGRQR